ncbi:5-oxoprolinase subunit PxpB [Synoicihabitans lomoniglobus]|uniref:5-oxoprolinase subunit PxpB n=2 Tax=Synoicihabitans lomoniglobus TaxID=2909285 RepID=A0AAF0CRJ4_9BACT|nr:5-oxoprolinase subunit PxpB [Opitutaceae bacterium LMO-M01]
MTIKVLGDTALLVEAPPLAAPAAAAWVRRATAAIRAENWPEVVEVVPALTGLALHFRSTTENAELDKRVHQHLESCFATESATPLPAAREVELPVCYEGKYGPDLPLVGEQARLSPTAMAAAHAAGTYTVQAIGFSPGFPYLMGLDPKLACPRRATPRTSVPAGSVGIGGNQTGVYPHASPGGWNIIGRTPEPLFDPRADDPCRLRAGDQLKFRAISAVEFERHASALSRRDAGADPATESPAAIEVLLAGVQTTVQDRGRPGFQSLGVTEGGAVDRRALRLANALVGNAPDAAVLEWPLRGPQLFFRDRRLVAVTGAIAVGVPFCRPFIVDAGEVLDLSQVPTGCRGIVAISGGVEVPVVMGSRSTHLNGQFGGFRGRALRKGDVLALGATRVVGAKPGWMVSPSLSRPVTGDVAKVRVVRGPEEDLFDTRNWERLVDGTYVVSAHSDRMGMRLDGPQVRAHTATELTSGPVAAGTVQMPPDGQPIVLLADRQSLGGYPRIAGVITVDLPVVAQVPPGSALQFTEVSLAEAEDLRLQEERDFKRFESTVASHFVLRS